MDKILNLIESVSRVFLPTLDSEPHEYEPDFENTNDNTEHIQNEPGYSNRLQACTIMSIN